MDKPYPLAKIRRESFIVDLGGVLLLVVLLATYANHFYNGFHYDDGHTIVNLVLFWGA